MNELINTRPHYAILLTDLMILMLALKDRHPELSTQAKEAIQEGRYYEQN